MERHLPLNAEGVPSGEHASETGESHWGIDPEGEYGGWSKVILTDPKDSEESAGNYQEDRPSRLLLWIVGAWIVLITLAVLYATLA